MLVLFARPPEALDRNTHKFHTKCESIC
jgi:hypothetical protein